MALLLRTKAECYLLVEVFLAEILIPHAMSLLDASLSRSSEFITKSEGVTCCDDVILYLHHLQVRCNKIFLFHMFIQISRFYLSNNLSECVIYLTIFLDIQLAVLYELDRLFSVHRLQASRCIFSFYCYDNTSWSGCCLIK